uniref:Uncharacterized LOC100178698 n=1 Tax=Ciona intestinalis TaxID=7719 RepID=F6WZ78_CIOIN|nr:uncharacterized protein LOC100178698 [Ciona intestinalis]|eukprot:XP_026692302.1 uncharacterized protein LOC100178698 [Ciona intestinalis]
MKVIYAGYSKTGTKTMGAVFREFGYNTYDWLENCYYIGEDWKRIIKEGGTVDDFRRMYKGVDAVVDGPSYAFWEELSLAFPEAKLIFCVRNEQEWLRSMINQLKQLDCDWLFKIFQVFSYTGWKYFSFSQIAEPIVVSPRQRRWPWTKYEKNPVVLKQLYRNHNASFLQNAPKDKLLIYNFGDGWGPICEFLGEKVPDKPFPHANKEASLVKDWMQSNPVMKRMMRETMFSLGVLTLIGAYGGYKVYQNPASIRGWINAAMTRFKL